MNEVTWEFHWLLELFEPAVEGKPQRSRELYIAAVESPWGVTTQGTHEAKRFSKEEADSLASTLTHPSGVWRAMEHGFQVGP